MKLQLSPANPTDCLRLKAAFEKHQHELLRHAQLKLGTEDVAADLVQEAFSRALTAKNLERVQNLRAYLFRIVTHLAIDHHRSLKQAHRFVDVEVSENVVHSVATVKSEPSREIIDRERVEILARAIKALPADIRKMFILYKLRGWKQQRIADHYGVSLSTVEKKIKRAVQQCRKNLEE